MSRGAGTIELRIQTASNVSGAFGVAFTTEPGVAYDFKTHDYLVNLIGGAAYFLSPAVALGLDASFTRTGGSNSSNDATFIAVAPFIKLVTGMKQWKPGFFVELSPGFLHARDPDPELRLRAEFFELSLWPGGHVHLGNSVAILVGPTVTLLERLSGEAYPNNVLVGFRTGLSVYLP